MAPIHVNGLGSAKLHGKCEALNAFSFVRSFLDSLEQRHDVAVPQLGPYLLHATQDFRGIIPAYRDQSPSFKRGSVELRRTARKKRQK